MRGTTLIHFDSSSISTRSKTKFLSCSLLLQSTPSYMLALGPCHIQSVLSLIYIYMYLIYFYIYMCVYIYSSIRLTLTAKTLGVNWSRSGVFNINFE